MSDSPPFISVIISTRNMRDLLRAAVESLFRQDYPVVRFEIIVIDNSSTDGTEEVIRSIETKTSGMLRYYRKENEGPGASRNFGIRQARGDIVAFTDSDCIAHPRWLKNGVAKMTNGIGIVQGKTLPNPDQTLTALSRTQSITNENGMYQTCNIFYRKDALDMAGGFSPDFCGLNCFGKPRWGGEDTDLAWRVKEQGWKSVFADNSLVYHHIFPLRPWQVITSMRGYQFQGLFYAIPYLVKRHPGLRRHFYFRYFLSKEKALFDIFLLSVVSGLLFHPLLFLLTLPYLTERSKSALFCRPLRQYHRGFVVFITRVLSDLADFILLFGGSIWQRTIIL
jgi:glycosyltransferase involved in cell wall biosynthesis